MATRTDQSRRGDEDVSTTTACPDCNGQVTTTGAETRCTDCGLVLDDQPIDHGPAQRAFDDDRERTGAPLTLGRHDRGLSTEIGQHRDGHGQPLSATKRRQLSRLRTRHTRARFDSKQGRNLAYACGEIARIVSALELPATVREAASKLFREAQANALVRGRSIETIAAGSVYGACRCGQWLRPIEEVAAVAKADQDKVLLGFRVLNRELGLATRPLTAGDVVPRLCDALDVPARVRKRTAELAVVAQETGVGNGRSPSGTAAGCLYLAGREHDLDLTQVAVADAADVTPMTVRRRWRELENHG